jgi:hypothetical protein
MRIRSSACLFCRQEDDEQTKIRRLQQELAELQMRVGESCLQRNFIEDSAAELLWEQKRADQLEARMTELQRDAEQLEARMTKLRPQLFAAAVPPNVADSESPRHGSLPGRRRTFTGPLSGAALAAAVAEASPVDLATRLVASFNLNSTEAKAEVVAKIGEQDQELEAFLETEIAKARSQLVEHQQRKHIADEELLALDEMEAAEEHLLAMGSIEGAEEMEDCWPRETKGHELDNDLEKEAAGAGERLSTSLVGGEAVSSRT